MSQNEAVRVARPRFGDIDAWGATHPGHVRTDNQDHFFAGALARSDGVQVVSVTDQDRLHGDVDRLASLGVVADGVGGVSGGKEAARVAVQDHIAAVARFFEVSDVAGSDDPDVFSRLLQVGDSRCYIFMNGKLTQISRDQTVAQELVDSGVMTRTVAESTRWAHVLSSAIGGTAAAPVVTRVVRDWGAVVLLCSDGLTRHVSDERIEARLAGMTSARQVAEQLVQDALDGGGSDNVTVVVGRTLPPR